MKIEENTEQTKNYEYNLTCSHLLSPEFSEAIQGAYDNETRRRNIVNVTRAYYVYIDLKGGISIDRIEAYRLNIFHSFLMGYVSLNTNDQLSYQLWEICDKILSKNSNESDYKIKPLIGLVAVPHENPNFARELAEVIALENHLGIEVVNDGSQLKSLAEQLTSLTEKELKVMRDFQNIPIVPIEELSLTTDSKPRTKGHQRPYKYHK